MKDVNLNADDEGSVKDVKKDVTDDEGSVQRLIDPAYDPVYGPTSKHFWPGSYLYATTYVLSPTHLSTYVSGEEFLEMYDDQFSGISDYLASTDYPDESYSDTLRDHFHSLYDDVESWDTTTLFVSAVYRGLFDEIRPYQSQLLELRTRLDYESIWENYLKEGREDEALAVYGSYVRKGDKREGKLCISTCCRLMGLILDPYTDLLLISEMIKVLHRTSIVATHQKELQEGFFLELEFTDPLSTLRDETRRDLYRERFVMPLSLLQINSETAQKAIDDAFSSLSYEPIIRLIRDHPSKSGFAGASSM